MAITYLTGGAAQRVSGSVTVSVTVGGTDQFMISCLATQGAQTISTATFDGTSLTQILEIAGGTGGSAARLSVDCLVLGTTSKTADWDQVVTGISGSPGGVSVYEGVDQSTPYRTAATDSANTDKTSVSLSPTSAVGDVVVDFLSRRGITEDVTPDGSQTERWQQSDVLSVLCFSSDLAGNASSTTMGCSWASGAQRAVYAALALIPAAAGGGGPSVNINGSTVNWNGLTSYNWNGVA